MVGWPFEPVTGYAPQFPVVEDDAEVRERVGPISEEAGIADGFVLSEEAWWSDMPAPEPVLT